MRWRTGEHNRQVQQKLDDFEYGMPLKIGQKEAPWSTVTAFSTKAIGPFSYCSPLPTKPNIRNVETETQKCARDM